MDLDARLLVRAAEQYGVIARSDAVELGFSPDQIHRRLRSGLWRPVHRNVYVVAGAPPTWSQRAYAALAAAGPDAFVSHASAARIHGLDGAPARTLEITVPERGLRRLRGVLVHRSRHLEAEDVVTVGRLRVSSMARCVVECSGSVSMDRLARMTDSGLMRGIPDAAELVAVADRLRSAPRRSRPRMVLVAARRGREGQRAESRPEMRVFRAIKRAGLPVPVQQHEVVVDGERFRLDFAYPDLRLAIEYQGFDPHRTRRAFDRDYRRDRALKAAGWTVLYFTSGDSDADIVRALRPFVA